MFKYWNSTRALFNSENSLNSCSNENSNKSEFVQPWTVVDTAEVHQEQSSLFEIMSTYTEPVESHHLTAANVSENEVLEESLSSADDFDMLLDLEEALTALPFARTHLHGFHQVTTSDEYKMKWEKSEQEKIELQVENTRLKSEILQLNDVLYTYEETQKLMSIKSQLIDDIRSQIQALELQMSQNHLTTNCNDQEDVKEFLTARKLFHTFMRFKNNVMMCLELLSEL